MSRITLQELPCPSALLPRLDHREADAEFLRCAAAADGTFYAVRAGGEAVGLAQAEPGWLYLYIFPEHRRRGYASGAVPLLVEPIRLAGNPGRYIRYAVETPFRLLGKRRPFL